MDKKEDRENNNYAVYRRKDTVGFFHNILEYVHNKN
jgi:hypothetical protein